MHYAQVFFQNIITNQYDWIVLELTLGSTALITTLTVIKK